MLSLAIIIPVFNKWELTQGCLRSLAEHTPCRPAQVIVVDNGSTDETAALCLGFGQELFGESFVYIRFEENRNFGPACNAGASKAHTDLLFFLNNDTLLTPGWLAPLLQEMEKPDAPVGVGPLLLYGSGRVQHLGIAFFPAGATAGHLYRMLPGNHPLAARRRQFQALTAAALMLSRQVFLDAGGFYEEFINGFEDVDLCLRLTGGGKRMTVIPESRIFHLESQTPKRHDFDVFNGQLLRNRHDLARHDDYVELMAEDGYVPKVEADLTVKIAVPPERNLALLRRLNQGGNLGIERCRALLEEEPYWENGYVLLSRLFENQGDWDAALAVYHAATQLIPSAEMVDTLIKTAKRAGIPADSLQEACPYFVDFILDEPAYMAKFQCIRSILLHFGHKNLLPLYKNAVRRAAQFRAEWKG